MFREHIQTFQKAFAQSKNQSPGLPGSSSTGEDVDLINANASAVENITLEAVINEGQIMEPSASPGPNSVGFFAQAHHFNINNGEFTFVQGNQYKINWEQQESQCKLSDNLWKGESFKKYYSVQALHDYELGAQQRRNPCIEGTRVEILAEIEAWACNPNGPSGYWICGMAGTGKSTIAKSMCLILQEKHSLAGSFFCSRQIPECRDYRFIIPTLAFQLAQYSLEFNGHFRKLLAEDPDIITKSPYIQVLELLVNPWVASIQTRTMQSYTPVFVLDALDECDDVSETIKALIPAIQSNKMPGLKFFFTSRPERAIQALMMVDNDSVQQVSMIKEFVLHNKARTWDFDNSTCIELSLAPECIAFSYDGTRIVSGSSDVRIWNATTGAQIGDPSKGHNSTRITSVAFSPNGTRIVSGSLGGTVRMWDANTGNQIGEPLQGHDRAVASVAKARTWDFDNSTCIELSLAPECIAFSYDGTRIVSGSSDVRIWNATTGAQIGDPSKGHNSTRITSVAFSPNGTRIVSGSLGGTVRMWDANTGNQIGEPLQGHDRAVASVAFSPNGSSMVSASQDMTIKIWDATTGVQIGSLLQGYNNSVLSVSLSPDGTRVACACQVCIINICVTTTGGQIKDFWQHYDYGHMASVALSPDGTRLASASEDGFIKIWDITPSGVQMGCPSENQDHNDLVTSVAVSPAGTRAAPVSWETPIRIWNATAGSQAKEPWQGSKPASLVAFSPDGTRIASASWDNIIRIWDVTTGAQVGDPLKGHNGWITSVAFSPDRKRVISMSQDKTIRVWDATTTGAQLGDPWQGHNKSITSVAFSPEGIKIASGSEDKTVRIWDSTTGVQVGDPFRSHEDCVSSVSFSPDGTMVASASWDKTIRMWDATTGAQVADPLQGHEKIISVTFSPDGA
ncbi:hypothetical protein GYMLUDRAFT_245767 [Collybiopsis luxurians FD-317 M1]|uniref:Nephrocystin 3-like N-terminal domain-containing protein n=1 Tax=Collybiopsis luxurians FD-317 M1 TaxID=944289 RepID=A0A0D0B6J6_9AGAR|nr:hypothetical protein GYMLUDRAFT_245767 [Collybiopsis luxurians FD-317 M1]